MKKNPSKPKRPRVQSVDFRGGVRGKHYERYHEGPVTIKIDSDVARATLHTASERSDRVVEHDFSKPVRGKSVTRYRPGVAQRKPTRSRRKP
jgi:hypothetical protein